MNLGKHIFWEIILIISSVFIFRSMWVIMDSVPSLSTANALWIMLIIGFVASILSYRKLTHSD